MAASRGRAQIIGGASVYSPRLAYPYFRPVPSIWFFWIPANSGKAFCGPSHAAIPRANHL